jgi:tRNA(Ile)-lysidine synthase
MSRSLVDRVDAFISRNDLISPGGRVTCLVSGGADSTCLFHVLRTLGFDVVAVHVHHGVRGAEADADAEHCRTLMGAEVVRLRPRDGSEAELRRLRYQATAGYGLRATGHTASDQVETVLYRLVTSGTTRGIRARRSDGVVRPLLDVIRAETAEYCAAHGLAVREDTSNRTSKRGQIRDEILPALRRLDARVDANLRALGEREAQLPRALERSLVELLSSCEGSATADLAGGIRAVREYDVLRLEGTVSWGPWTLEATRPGLTVRGRRPGDRLAGRRKKVQDVLVDAKVPRSERDGWPLVLDGEEVVAIPGVAVAPGWEGVVTARRVTSC